MKWRNFKTYPLSILAFLDPNKCLFLLSKRELELWLTNLYPVLLVLYDAQKDVAYYVDLQPYFQEDRILLKNVRKFVRVYISSQSIFDNIFIKKMRDINFNKYTKII